MNVGIVDADLIDNGTRHPNLALMKLSAFLKEAGHACRLVKSAEEISNFESTGYDKLIVST